MRKQKPRPIDSVSAKLQNANITKRWHRTPPGLIPGDCPERLCQSRRFRSSGSWAPTVTAGIRQLIIGLHDHDPCIQRLEHFSVPALRLAISSCGFAFPGAGAGFLHGIPCSPRECWFCRKCQAARRKILITPGHLGPVKLNLPFV